MKAKCIYAVMAIVFAVFVSSCGNNNRNARHNDQTPITIVDTVHTSRTSLDYEGTYTGTMPCADCEGIYTELTLRGDQTYTLKTVYQGTGNNEQNTFEESGKYTWNNSGNIITLNNDSDEQYQVGENMLIALDQNGNRITDDLADMYILRKR